MKIDSEYLDIDILPEYTNQHGKMKFGQKLGITFFETGNIYIDDEETSFIFDADTLEEIVRVYKLFRDRRIAYLNKT